MLPEAQVSLGLFLVAKRSQLAEDLTICQLNNGGVFKSAQQVRVRVEGERDTEDADRQRGHLQGPRGITAPALN